MIAGWGSYIILISIDIPNENVCHFGREACCYSLVHFLSAMLLSYWVSGYISWKLYHSHTYYFSMTIYLFNMFIYNKLSVKRFELWYWISFRLLFKNINQRQACISARNNSSQVFAQGQNRSELWSIQIRSEITLM